MAEKRQSSDIQQKEEWRGTLQPHWLSRSLWLSELDSSSLDLTVAKHPRVGVEKGLSQARPKTHPWEGPPDRPKTVYVRD